MSTPGTKVVLLRWPHDESALERLRDERRPRLLLVDPDGPTPEIADELEDWVRVPAPQQDIQARILVLEQRSHQQQSTDLEIDDDGVLTVRNDQIVLGPIAAALFRALLERDGAVISRDDLMRAGWTSGDATRN
ncbi:MAG: hypothetical protein GX868_14000, partial [Actinobacteria bacterium]|nr:hypothetical protein [Actinomycetota bacterium]